jgi:hypothetical protein
LRGAAEGSDGGFPLKVIDFIAPEGGRTPKFPDGRYGVFSDSPLEFFTRISCRECQNALIAAKTKLERLSPPAFRLGVYPKPSTRPEFASLLDPTRHEIDLGNPLQPKSYGKFLEDLEAQLRNTLLNPDMNGFTDGTTTLAKLFGLTDTGEVWQDPEFGVAIESARNDESIMTFDVFFDSVFRRMTGEPPPPISPGVANKSMNYALAMLRWYGIWIGRRIKNMEQYFAEGVQQNWRF